MRPRTAEVDASERGDHGERLFAEPVGAAESLGFVIVQKRPAAYCQFSQCYPKRDCGNYG
jgi:hypothetical protein